MKKNELKLKPKDSVTLPCGLKIENTRNNTLVFEMPDEISYTKKENLILKPTEYRRIGNTFAFDLRIQGDTPCADCGTEANIIWFTDNVFWNEVMNKTPNFEKFKENDETGKILCINCFVSRAERKFKTTGWRLLPDFKWEEK